MSVPKLAQSVIDARVTMQRLNDAKILHGWVIAFDSSHLVVRLNETFQISPDSKFACRICRQGGDVAFIATAAGSLGEAQHFEIEGRLAMLASQGDPRYSRKLEGTMDGSVVSIVDVSPRGVGVVSPMPFRAGEGAEIALEGMSVFGEVRYCRPLRPPESGYRLGIQLQEMGRIERARWLDLVYGGLQEELPPSGTRLAI